MFVITLALWPIAALVRYGRRLDLDARSRRLRLLVPMICFVDLIFVAAFAIIFSLALKDIGMLTEALDPWLILIEIIGWIGLLGTAFVLYSIASTWRNRGACCGTA